MQAPRDTHTVQAHRHARMHVHTFSSPSLPMHADMHTHTCMHTHTSTCIPPSSPKPPMYADRHTHTGMHTHLYTHAHTHMTHTHTHTPSPPPSHPRADIHTHICDMLTHAHTHIHPHACTSITHVHMHSPSSPTICPCMQKHTHMQACSHVYIHAHTIHTCLHAHPVLPPIHPCMQTRTRITHTHACTRPPAPQEPCKRPLLPRSHLQGGRWVHTAARGAGGTSWALQRLVRCPHLFPAQCLSQGSDAIPEALVGQVAPGPVNQPHSHGSATAGASVDTREMYPGGARRSMTLASPAPAIRSPP